MKILLSHRYFWPDTAPYAFLLRAIGEDVSSADRVVHIYCSKPSYRKGTVELKPKREILGSLNVYRCWVFQEEGASAIVRAVNVFLYTFGLFFRIMVLRPNVVTASTFPPVFAAYIASLGAKIVGAKFIYHMQDIHPEVSEISGGLLSKKPIVSIFRWFDNQTLKRASGIVVLSEDMRSTLRERELGDLPIHVINNFPLDDGAQLGDPPIRYAKSSGKKRIIFAGNLGRFQNLQVLAAGVVMWIESRPDYELLFLGDGKAAAGLRDTWGHHPQVTFAPFLPLEQAKPLIAQADVGLVSLSRGVYKVAYPSKVSTYISLGVPILALVERESAMARDLTDIGVAVIPLIASSLGIAAALDELVELNKTRGEIIASHEMNFGREVSAEKWRAILDCRL